MKALLREVGLAALMLSAAGTTMAEAKGLAVSINALMYRPVKAVMLAHVAPDGAAAIIIDTVYLGSFKPGERVPVEMKTLNDDLTVPGGKSQPEMFLVLTQPKFLASAGIDEREEYGRMYFAPGLVIDEWLSRRISDGRVYDWPASTKAVGYSFWSWFTNTASLERDDEDSNQTALESDLAEGLSRRDEWMRAQAATDPAEKLRLLRPFLLPGGPHKLTDYEFCTGTGLVREEAETAGPAAVPFFEQLLKEPAYQEDYAPDNWRGLGAQERAALLKSLAMAKARNAATPQEKLAALRPVFDIPTFDTVAGYYPQGLVREYFDEALALATSVDTTDARAFLQELLTLPQFQDGYTPIFEKSFGHEFRQKIQTALAALH